MKTAIIVFWLLGVAINGWFIFHSPTPEGVPWSAFSCGLSLGFLWHAIAQRWPA